MKIITVFNFSHVLIQFQLFLDVARTTELRNKDGQYYST